jgi:hypothetical protein
VSLDSVRIREVGMKVIDGVGVHEGRYVRYKIKLMTLRVVVLP